MRVLRQMAILFRDEKRSRLALLLVLGVAVGAAEVVGALMVFALLGLVASPTSGVEVPLLGRLPELFPGLTPRGLLVTVAVTVAVYFAFRAVLIIAQSYVQMRIVYNAGARLSGRLVDGYLRRPYVWHVRRNTSELMRNTFQASHAVVQERLLPLVTVGSEVILVSAMLALLLVMAPVETLVAAGVMTPVIWLLTRIVQPRLKILGETFMQASGQSLQAFQQAVGALRELRVLGREEYFSARFMEHRRRLSHAQYLHGTMQNVPRATIESTLIIIIAALLLIAVFAGDDLENLLARLGLFAYAGLRLQPSLQKVVRGLQDIRFSGAAASNLVTDLQQFDDSASISTAKLGIIGPMKNDVALREVTFTYDSDAPPALHDVNLTIERGQVIGICGPTGGGKSTLVDVIAGLLVPTRGQVEIDGVDLTRDPAAWYSQLGVVSQTVFLIDDTLRNNIALGVGDAEVDEDRLQRAIERAQLVEAIDELPSGLDTFVGELGVRLSGGQRQRVAVARALYREPAVMIFDEGTSALDNLTEARLVEELMQAESHPTIIMVAHRLSTVRDADRILVVEAGRIVGDGKHDDLLNTSPTFRALAQ